MQQRLNRRIACTFPLCVGEIQPQTVPTQLLGTIVKLHHVETPKVKKSLSLLTAQEQPQCIELLRQI